MARMPGFTRSWFGLALVLPGLLLTIAGLAVVPDMTTTTYHHEISPTSESDVPTGPDRSAGDPQVFDYDDLSSSGKAIVRGSVNASDGRYTVTEGDQAPEFTYDSGVETLQYVQYDGQYYALRTNEEGHLGEMIALWAIVLGVVATTIGGWLSRQFGS